ncbi:hypothetical protein B0H67DRAFT_644848 [Lasiosphaeris hirsuta]|uniref:Uncharacterized protein n=1 Tax=Lasiosphaeris hirsuta TaxID=260670 RepID=A0AA40DTM2_9PEZI|nr:hypothetical protein B0H67DRAFT_644848 [Lasiosphaeris hirsuta]
MDLLGFLEAVGAGDWPDDIPDDDGQDDDKYARKILADDSNTVGNINFDSDPDIALSISRIRKTQEFKDWEKGERPGVLCITGGKVLPQLVVSELSSLCHDLETEARLGYGRHQNVLAFYGGPNRDKHGYVPGVLGMLHFWTAQLLFKLGHMVWISKSTEFDLIPETRMAPVLDKHIDASLEFFRHVLNEFLKHGDGTNRVTLIIDHFTNFESDQEAMKKIFTELSKTIFRTRGGRPRQPPVKLLLTGPTPSHDVPPYLAWFRDYGVKHLLFDEKAKEKQAKYT